jgi:hypothetical protein
MEALMSEAAVRHMTDAEARAIEADDRNFWNPKLGVCRLTDADERAVLHTMHARSLQSIAKYKTSARVLTEGEKQVLQWHIENAQVIERALEKLGKV